MGADQCTVHGSYHDDLRDAEKGDLVSDRLLPGIQSTAKKSNPWPWVAVGVMFAVLALVIGFSLTSGGEDDDYDSNTSYEAIAQCEDAIKDRLKAPTTAEFDSTATGSGTWTVTGTVDAENSFGAKIRSSYQCSVIIDNAKDTAKVRVDRFE